MRPRRSGSKRWRNTCAQSSDCPGCSSTIPPVCERAPRPGRARRRGAVGDGAVVQRVGCRTDALPRLATHAGRHGLAHDIGAAGLRPGGTRLGGPHAERPLVGAATRPGLGARGGARDVRGRERRDSDGRHRPARGDGRRARRGVPTGDEDRGRLVPRRPRLGDRHHGRRAHARLGVAGALALLGAGLMALVPHDGPFTTPALKFSWSALPRILRERAVTLANLGYLGHMWELYAMWTWIAAFVAASEQARTGAAPPAGSTALVTFAVVGSGAAGCWLGGKYADRWGRTLVTSVAMALSGACALAVGTAFGHTLALLLPVLLVWGVSVVADSAQFSASVSELAPRDLVGTALTLQTSLGFLLTCLTIYLLPWVAARMGWRWSMSLLALGPACGVWAMLMLRRRPEAASLAGGRG